MTTATNGWNPMVIERTGRWRRRGATGIRAVLAAAAMILAVGGTAMYLSTSVAGQSAEFANFEGSQTSPIRLSPDGTRLFAVNTANASLSVFNVSDPAQPVLIREIPVGLEPVSVNPRSNDEAWVVNQLSDSVSIVSVPRGIVIATLKIPDEPMDVVFAGVNQAYVSVSRSNAVAVFDTRTRALTRTLPLFGGNPRALAVSPDGTTVYAAFALAGNGTTLLRDVFAPPPPPPTHGDLPPAPQVARIVRANSPLFSAFLGFRMPDNDVAIIRAGDDPTVTGYYAGVGTVNFGLAVNPANGDLFVANTEARNLIRFVPNLRGHWVDNRVTRINVSTGRITPFDLNPDIDYAVLPNPDARATALAQPTAIVFDEDGESMYVAAFGTDRVARMDASGNVLSFVEVGPTSGRGANVDPRTKRGPRGLALRADGRALYVLNRISNSISVIDPSTESVVRELRVGTDPTPLAIRVGRGFLYDAKLSGNGTGACASCHVDGDMDHLAWDLGDPGGEMITVVQLGQTFEMHPMKGPMTTQTLKGLPGLTPLHWRGDKANFLEFNGAFEGLMGGTEIPTIDMLAFATFINTILFQPNPNQNLDRTLKTSLNGGNAVEGREAFLTVPRTRLQGGILTCNGCHKANPGAGTNRLIGLSTPQPLKIPQLRNIYQKDLFTRLDGVTIDGFGLDHEGHVSGFGDFFESAIFATYTERQKRDIAAFVMSFDTGTAPAVGYTITLAPENADDELLQADWTTLQQQAAARNIDVTVKGTVDGQVRELSYRPFFDDYAVSGVAGAFRTRAQLQAGIDRGDILTIIGVPPREGISGSVAASSTDDPATTVEISQRGKNRGH